MNPSHTPIDPARWYATLALLACVATFQALVLPRWPRAAEIDHASIENAMRSSGLNVVPLKTSPSHRSFDLASSELLKYKLDDGQELQLVDVTVRERLKFDMNMITSKHPSLRLEDGHISPHPPFYANGRIEGRPARQTCLVPGLPGTAAFAVSQEQLWVPVDALARENTRESLLRLIGLGGKRSYRCTLITLRAAADRPIGDARWQSLLRVLRPALERKVGPTAAQSTDQFSSAETHRHG